MKLLFSAGALALLAACVPLKPTTRHDVFKPQAELPHEEAPHPRNSLEWWYFTGHLKDQATGEAFGVEYVFFHFNPNGKQDYQMVNVAVTDPQGQRFAYDYKLEKLPRPLTDSLPLRLHAQKGAQTWTLRGQEGRYELQAAEPKPSGTGLAPAQNGATPNAVPLRFTLTTAPAKPVLLHGGTGYEQYGSLAQAGYYSYPRLTTTGTLELGGKTHQVAGELWYDRQWNCGGVNKKHVAWDWLSLQLNEPREELMLYAVHNKQAGQHIAGGGSHYSAQNENHHLAETDFQLEPLTYWTSPRSGRQYPAKWRVQVPAQGYDLVVEPLVPDQELGLKVFKVFNLYYWEGMCRVTGTHRGQPVTGNAYVEITNR